LSGVIQSINSKSSPIIRTIIGQRTNTKFNGAPITNPKNNMLQNMGARVIEAGNTFLPIPFGVANSVNYNKSGEQTLGGNLLVGTGAGSYAKDKTNPNDPTASYQGNWINKYVNPDPNQKVLNDVNIFKSANLKNSKAMNTEIQNAVKSGSPNENETNILTKYNITDKQYQTKVKAQQKTLDKFNQPALAQGFGTMSRADQLNYISSHPEQSDKLTPLVKKK